MSAHVYDFATRRRMTTGQDTEENDLHSEGKTYIGNIGKQNATAFRNTVEVLESLSQRLADLTAELEEVGSMHFGNIDYIITLLNAEGKLDIGAEDLMVSEDGHVWIVPLEMTEEAEE